MSAATENDLYHRAYAPQFPKVLFCTRSRVLPYESVRVCRNDVSPPLLLLATSAVLPMLESCKSGRLVSFVQSTAFLLVSFHSSSSSSQSVSSSLSVSLSFIAFCTNESQKTCNQRVSEQVLRCGIAHQLEDRQHHSLGPARASRCFLSVYFQLFCVLRVRERCFLAFRPALWLSSVSLAP